MSLILHIDGDAFFASCEVSRRPDLRGRPVVVGEEKGIANALTYEAKKLGVYRGMPIFEIRKQFPEVTVISSHFNLYEEYQRKLLSILKEYLPKVEPYSIDECFAFLPNLERSELIEFVTNLKHKIQSSLGITYSFGIAKTKTLAKVASKRDKPNGLVFLDMDDDVLLTLSKTPVGAIWGIGRKISAELIAQNIKTALEFIQTEESKIKSDFNLPTLETYHELKGTRIFEISEGSRDQKTIQATRSLSKGTFDPTLLFSEISRNVETACIHLRESGLLTNSIHVFYRIYGEGRESRGTDLAFYTDDPRIILKAVKTLTDKIFKPNTRYKSTGITLLNLKSESNIQSDLFGNQNNHLNNHSYLKVIDNLNRKFGPWSVMHASSLKSVRKREQESKIRDAKDNYEYNLPLPYMGEVY